MKQHKLRVLFVFLLVVCACSKALPQEKVLYRAKSQFAELVVTEDDQGIRSLRYGDEPNCQSMVKVGDPDEAIFEYVQATPVALTLVKEPKRVLMVGLGGGSIPMLLRKHYPKMTIDIVDIDPDVVMLAKKYFGFKEDDAMKVYVEDGRKFIERSKQPYDLILLNAYGPDNIPYSLATKEFLEATRKAVGPNGIVEANVWSIDSNKLHNDMERTYQEVFDDLYVVHAFPSSNEIFLALPHKEEITKEDLAKRAVKLAEDLKLRFDVSEYVKSGYRHSDKKNEKAKVLLDKEAPK
jgi:spermidine synthase